MGSYRRKDGARVITTTVYDKEMNKRGISKVVHVIPGYPAHESLEFAKLLATMFGDVLRSGERGNNDLPAKQVGVRRGQTSD